MVKGKLDDGSKNWSNLVAESSQLNDRGGAVANVFKVLVLVEIIVVGTQVPSVQQCNEKWALGSPMHRRCPKGPPGPEWKTS